VIISVPALDAFRSATLANLRAEFAAVAAGPFPEALIAVSRSFLFGGGPQRMDAGPVTDYHEGKEEPRMTVTIELTPELEARLLAQAQAAGVSMQGYVQSVVEAAALSPVGQRPTLEEFEAAMDEMAEGTDDIPVLSPDATSRESIYGHRA
jgi:hypothetical protein